MKRGVDDTSAARRQQLSCEMSWHTMQCFRPGFYSQYTASLPFNCSNIDGYDSESTHFSHAGAYGPIESRAIDRGLLVQVVLVHEASTQRLSSESLPFELQVIAV